MPMPSLPTHVRPTPAIGGIRLGAIVRINYIIDAMKEDDYLISWGLECRTLGCLGVVMRLDPRDNTAIIYTSRLGDWCWYRMDWFTAVEDTSTLYGGILNDLAVAYAMDGDKARRPVESAKVPECAGCAEATMALKKRVRELADESDALRIKVRARLPDSS